MNTYAPADLRDQAREALTAAAGWRLANLLEADYARHLAQHRPSRPPGAREAEHWLRNRRDPRFGRAW